MEDVIREARRRRQRRRLFVAGLIFLLGLFVAGLYLVLGNRLSSPARTESTSPTGPPWITRPIPGFSGGAAVLAVDPTNPGVWFLSQERTVDFWNSSTHSLRTYVLSPPSSLSFSYGILAGLAVGRDGIVWVGAGTTLAAITESTGAVAYSTPPQPGPPNPLAAIESVAVGPQDQVAIAYSNSPNVDVRSPSGGYSIFTLPDGLLPNQVAYLSDGALGVAATVPRGAGYNSVVLDHDGIVSAVHAPSWSITPAGNGFLTSMQDVAFVKPSVTGVTVRYVVMQGNLPRTLRIGASSQALGPWVLASTTTGFIEVDRTSSAVRVLSLPTSSCEGISIPAVGGASGIHRINRLPKNCRIQESPTHFVVDHQGDIWFTNNFGGQLLEANPASSSWHSG